MVLLVLSGLALAMLCVPEDQAHALRSQTLSAFAPVFSYFASTRPVTASTHRNADGSTPSPEALNAQLTALAQDRDRLKHENILLREQFRQFAALQDAWKTSSGLGAKGLPARVIARQVLWQEPLLGVDQGSANGVRQGSGVLYRGAALGRVVSAAPNASCVALFTHPSVTVTARLAEGRAEGVLQGMKPGENGERLCRMKVVSHDLQAREGEAVVTSGLDGSFPAGCLLGTVARIERSGDMEWTLTVKPACTETNVEAVFVLTTPPQDVPWPRKK
ncbi:MAG: rod shape-determining protein MreC [Planctomycetota bacterium]|nr:rod shape-determining protein MreC [Planctomycetota bacterium]